MNALLLLARTMALRPYVFAFLAGFLLLAVSAWGWRRTIVFALLGFGVAWAAEASSVRTGFPFGNYVYFSGSTQERELWLAGVPVMCSLSFVFLTFAGLQTARLVLAAVGRSTGGWWDRRWVEPTPPRGQVAAALLGGVLATGLRRMAARELGDHRTVPAAGPSRLAAGLGRVAEPSGRRPGRVGVARRGAGLQHRRGLCHRAGGPRRVGMSGGPVC